MKPIVCILLTISLLIIITFVDGQHVSTPSFNDRAIIKAQSLELNADTLFAIAQEWRVQNNLTPYVQDAFACEVSQIRIKDIHANFSHEGFDYKRLCKEVCSLGENIARDHKNEQDTFNGWIHSPSHLKNLRAPFPKSCIATSGTYAVQIFSY